MGAAITASAKLRVVTTTADFGSIASAVGGKDVTVTVLARPTEDPHYVDAKPSFIVQLNRADVLIEGGAELEVGWLPPLVRGARNRKIGHGAPGRIEAAEGLQLLGIPDKLDRSQGDIHASGNPHFMVDPVRAGLVAERVAAIFAKLDPKAASRYRANLVSFKDRLDGRIVKWKSQLAPYKGTSIVAYHDSWIYFAARFGLKLELYLEPKPGIPPSPSHLARLAVQMKEQDVKAVLVEPYVNRKTAGRVTTRTAATLVDVTHFPGGLKGTEEGYIQMMDQIVDSLAKALGSS